MSDAKLPERPSITEPGGDGEGFPTDVPALEALLAEVCSEEKVWDAYIRELAKLEDPVEGVFYAAELHEARQYRMVVRYRKNFCQARLKRLGS